MNCQAKKHDWYDLTFLFLFGCITVSNLCLAYHILYQPYSVTHQYEYIIGDNERNIPNERELVPICDCNKDCGCGCKTGGNLCGCPRDADIKESNIKEPEPKTPEPKTPEPKKPAKPDCPKQ